MLRQQAPGMPPYYCRDADTLLPSLWANRDVRGVPDGTIRRPLLPEERKILAARRDELAPWVAPYHGDAELDQVAAAICGMYDAFPHMAAKSEAAAVLRVDQLRARLAPFPAWAIAKVCERVASRGYARKEGAQHVQERHWAPSDPEVVEMVEQEVEPWRRAHDSAAALLLAAVMPYPKLSKQMQEEQDFVAKKLGTDPICDRCGATVDTFADDCSAELDDPCPGFLAIDKAKDQFKGRRR